MRKTDKEQIENFLTVLQEAHGQVRSMLQKKETGAALELLTECQNGAVALGTLIEKTEGEGFVTISILESYCERVYEAYEKVMQGENPDADKVYAEFEKMLAKIRNSVEKDIKIRKEVVFLPYKASMWDSLESVWKAAAAAPDCDAYVIPIPYYDKNSDGSFRQMHYEGGEYPSDVPVISYEKYNFEERHPDEIYIHNPYDEFNYVTSVHPFFYAKNLKKYTDKLVYIPYFVLPETAVQESMEHFAKVPGVIYADKVIVQSERIRELYINVLIREYGEDTRDYWENKIDGSGSPKFDKIMNTQIGEDDIPTEWKKILYKPDGTRKKVVLYNTSVTSLLNHSEQYIAKMYRVFDTFAAYQEEIVLLWRPHPLIQATIASMRSQLWKEYQKAVADYKEKQYGIYDDSAELDRAIGLADAYYGDNSSLVPLCQKVKMPVMIQEVED